MASSGEGQNQRACLLNLKVLKVQDMNHIIQLPWNVLKCKFSSVVYTHAYGMKEDELMENVLQYNEPMLALQTRFSQFE